MGGAHNRVPKVPTIPTPQKNPNPNKVLTKSTPCSINTLADDNIANNCSMSTPSTNMAATNANTYPSSSNIDEELGGGSSPSLGTSSFLSRQHHSNNANNKHHADDEAHNISERSSTSSITGRWKSLGSRRHIKFGMSSHPDDRRGILAIPMNEETSKAMNSVDRFKRTLFRRSSYNQEHDKEEVTTNECNEKQMYRLQVTRQNEVGCIRRSMACVMACLNCGAHTEQSTEQNLFLGLGSPNRCVVVVVCCDTMVGKSCNTYILSVCV